MLKRRDALLTGALRHRLHRALRALATGLARLVPR